MRKLGEDISEQLDFIPGTFKVLRACAPQAVLRTLFPGDPAAGPLAADRARAAGRGAAGAGDRGQVRRPLPAVSPAGHLPALWRGAGPRHPGRVGGRGLAGCSSPWSMPWAAMCSRPARCTPTIPRCRCWIRVAARPRPDGCGPTCAMIGRRAAAIPRRCGIATRPIARPSIRVPTCAPSTASCRPMPTLGSLRCTRAGASSRPRAGRTRDASSTTSTSRTTRRLPPRRSSASARSTPSSARFADGCPASVRR